MVLKRYICYMKGSLFDITFIIAVILIFSIIVFISFLLMDKFYDQALANPELNETVFETGKSALLNFDTSMPLIIIGLLITSLISAFLVNVHPAFIGISIIEMIVAIVMAVIYSNTFQEFASSGETANVANEFTVTVWVFNNLPALVLIMSTLIIIILFGKLYTQRQGL